MLAKKPDRPTLVPVNERGYRIGEAHHRAKLSDHDVELIHELIEAGVTQRQIAFKFEVSRSTIRDIHSGRCRSQSAARFKRDEPPPYYPSRCKPAALEEFPMLTYPIADATEISVTVLAEQLCASADQLISLTLLGWLPPASNVIGGVPFWSAEGAARLADAYGAWMALRVADDDASAVTSAALTKAAGR